MSNKTKIGVGLVALLLIAVATQIYYKSHAREGALNFYDEKPSGTRAVNVNISAGVSGVVEDKYAAATPAAPQTVKDSTERLVIKTGEISVVVKDVRDSVSKIGAYAATHGGYIVSSEVNQAGIAPSGTITIRIPVQVFDAGFSELKALGDVQSESITGEDVTDQYVDLSARLRNLQATETQLAEIMRRAVRIQDVLDVQEQLTDVRGEIEAMQGKIKFLKDSSSMSSLTINLSTDPSQLPVVHEATDSWKPAAVAKEAMRYLLDVGKTLGSIIIWLVIFIPLWLVVVGMIWLIVRIVKKVLKRGLTQNKQ